MDNISCLAGNIQLTGPAIRQYLIRFLEANKDVWGRISFEFFRRSLESQIFDIRNNEWADNFEIFAVATMFNITIETIDNAGTFIPIYPDRQGNIGQNNVGYLRMVYNETLQPVTITIGHIGQIHYVGVDNILDHQSTTQHRKIAVSKTYSEALREKFNENKSKSNEKSSIEKKQLNTNQNAYQNQKRIIPTRVAKTDSNSRMTPTAQKSEKAKNDAEGKHGSTMKNLNDKKIPMKHTKKITASKAKQGSEAQGQNNINIYKNLDAMTTAEKNL